MAERRKRNAAKTATVKARASAVKHAAVAEVPAASARRALLAAQGLFAPPDRPASTAEVARIIEQMGFVQVDTICVVERAHDLILATRLCGYRPAMLRSLVDELRTHFEHWTHDASIIPLTWFHHWKPRFERYRRRDPQNAWWKARLGPKPFEVIESVRRAVEEAGPMMSREFERDQDAKQKKSADPWWMWKPQKAALEFLWRTGELAVTKRINFQKVYDLTHRVFPEHHAQPAPDIDEHVEWACRSALERLVFATPAEVSRFWAAIDIAAAASWLKRAHAVGDVDVVRVQAADGSRATPMYAMPDWERRVAEAEQAPAPEGMRFINPFDPIIRDRARALRLFNFDYRFEAFTPTPKRKFGYYVMPLLDGDTLIGRCDAKHHRDRTLLEIKGVWWEKNGRAVAGAARRRRERFDDACERLAAFVGAHTISRERRSR